MPRKIYLVGEAYVQRFMRDCLLEHHPDQAARISRDGFRRAARGVLDRSAFPKPYYTEAQKLALNRHGNDYLRARVDTYLERVLKIEIIAGTQTAINNVLSSERNRREEQEDRT